MPRFRVYYPAHTMNKSISFLLDGDGVTGDNLRQTHRLIAVVEKDDLEDVFEYMQGENWSPKGEAYELIEALGVTHTSMSTGDVAVDEDDQCWLCASVGWKDIGKLPPR